MRRFFVVFVLVAMVVGVIFASGAAGGAVAALWVLDRHDSSIEVAEISRAIPEPVSSGFLEPQSDAEQMLDVVRTTRPAVVTVWSFQYGRRSLFSPIQLMRAESGSGVIFDDRGYIATNAHVISDAEAIEVVFHDGRRASAELVKGNLVYDVAILHVSDELPGVAPIGDSSQLEPGMRVLAIGSPLGTEYQNTVTEGIIAGLGRQVKVPRFDWSTMQYREVDIVGVPLIQTDAAINSGNSGGPLINLVGEVIGLNALIIRGDGSRTAVEGLGFAIPSNVVRALADEWIDGIRRPVLEVEFETLDPVSAAEQGLEHSTGAVITEVKVGSAAAKAGLTIGDRIVAIDDAALDLDHALADLLWKYRGGDTVRLAVDRDGRLIELDVQLGDGA